jgi:HEAT repeat protein
LNVLFPRVRRLADAGDVDGLVELLHQSTDPSELNRLSERALIAHRLGDLRAESAIPELAALLAGDVRVEQRVCAARALQRIGGRDAVQALRPALEDKLYGVRVAAVEATGAWPDPASAPKLEDLLANDPSVGIRMRAAEALGRVNGDAAIAALQAAIEHGGWQVSTAAVDALRSLGSPAAAKTFEALSHTAPGRLRRITCRRQAARIRRRTRRADQPAR